MKTPQEWISERPVISDSEAQDQLEIDWIKQIQVDAFKTGMLQAASIADEGALYFAAHKTCMIACEEVSRNIKLNIPQ